MRGFLRMELVDDLRRTHEPKNINNSRARGTGYSDQNILSWEANPDSFEILDTLIVILLMKIVPTENFGVEHIHILNLNCVN